MDFITKKQFDVKTMKQDLTDIATLNKEQHLAYAIVFDHFIQQSKDQLLILTGLVGSGKSYVINAMKTMLIEKCKVCAFFGIAAFNVKGKTLHSLLQLPTGGKRSSELKGQALQDEMDNVQYLIINEYSVIGQKMFGWINIRCKQAIGVSSLPFGGISVILVGDVGQLPPVTDKVIYHDQPSGKIGTEGYIVYRQFDKLLSLKSTKELSAQVRHNKISALYK